MKAKEYAARIISAVDCNIEIAEVIAEMIIDISAIAERRHAYTDAAMCEIVSEQDRKWRAIAHRIPNSRPDAFAMGLQRALPIVYATWQAHKRSKIGT